MIAGEDDEIIPLPGGMDPKRVEADIAANRAHVERILSNPETDEERAAQMEYFAAIQDRSDTGGARLKERQKRIAFAKVRLDEFLHMLEMWGPDETGPNIDHAKLAAANYYFMLGLFEEAFAITPAGSAFDPYRAKFQRYKEAEDRDDDDLCSCSDYVAMAKLATQKNGKLYDVPVFQTAHTVVGEFPSKNRHEWVLAIQCVQCDWLNLRMELTESAAREETAKATPGPDHIVMRDNGTCGTCPNP